MQQHEAAVLWYGVSQGSATLYNLLERKQERLFSCLSIFQISVQASIHPSICSPLASAICHALAAYTLWRHQVIHVHELSPPMPVYFPLTRVCYCSLSLQISSACLSQIKPCYTPPMLMFLGVQVQILWSSLVFRSTNLNLRNTVVDNNTVVEFSSFVVKSDQFC